MLDAPAQCCSCSCTRHDHGLHAGEPLDNHNWPPCERSGKSVCGWAAQLKTCQARPSQGPAPKKRRPRRQIRPAVAKDSCWKNVLHLGSEQRPLLCDLTHTFGASRRVSPRRVCAAAVRLFTCSPARTRATSMQICNAHLAPVLHAGKRKLHCDG